MCIKARTLETPIGKICLYADANGLCGLSFHAQREQSDASHTLDWAERELKEYFAGRRKAFSVPLSIRGTPFQQAVYRVLTEIPYGETRSYGSIAEQIGKKGAARAVGMANHRNPLPIFLPCHRVVGKRGELTGYAGGLEVKRILLEIEDKYKAYVEV